MSGKSNHSVKRILWDIQVGNPHAAAQWQDTVSEFSRTKLSSVLENSFERYDRHDQVLTIDRIEIDIEALTDTRELEAKLMEALQKSLHAKLPGAIQGRQTQKSEISIPASIADLNHLRHFLMRGYLPWNAKPNLISTSAELFEDLCSIESVHEWLTPILKNESSLIRFINFFSVAELETLLEKIALSDNLTLRFQTFFRELLIGADAAIQQKIQNTQYKLLRFKAIFKSIANNTSITEAILEDWWLDVKIVFHTSPESITSIENEIRHWAQPSQHTSPEHEIAVKAFTIIQQNSNPQVPELTAPLKTMAEEDEGNNDPDNRSFYIDNAGIVLAYPYLKQLFKALNLFNQENEFKDRRSKLLGCYWLQNLVTGKKEIPEYQLVLNKILCGYSLEEEIVMISEKDFTLDAQEIVNNHLKKIISGWEKIRTTSDEGFRTSFLQRNGKLTEEESNWLLVVERKGWDILLDTLPYPISIIKLPWMTKPLYVKW